MARRIILAVAGAGKTRHVCRSINPAKKNLLIAFTHENIKNLHKELRAVFGSCPELTDVMTFDSFVYQFAVRPYMPSILEHFSDAESCPCGITLKDSPQQRLKRKDGKGYYPNPKYHKKESFLHYVDEHNRLYCDTLSELVMTIGSGRRALIRQIAAGINRFYDYVAVDEFQDFREHEYELLQGLAKELENVLLVGDYYQHSIAAMKNSGKPFEKGKSAVSYNEFVSQMKNSGFEVDNTSLVKSWRCSSEVCSFVSRKLNILIESHAKSSGIVKLVSDYELNSVLKDEEIIKLVNKNANAQPFCPCRNWSYSKGDTYGRVCVILTGDTSTIFDDDFSCQEMSVISRNMLYVALTRTKGDLLLITKKQMDSWKKSQQITNSTRNSP